jgi:hypothetical protein
MMTDRRLLGVALGLALTVAACGGSSASPTPPPASEAPAASAAPASQAAMSEAPTQAPAASTEPSMPEISLTPGGASALESALPDSAGGVTFTKTSFDGSSIPGAGMPFDSSKLDPTLSKYGKSIADVKFAMAAASTGTPMIYALQLQGVPATTFMADAGFDTSSMTQTTISGKSVWSESAAGMSQIIYPKDDVVYMILLATDAQAQAILAALP